MIYYNCNFHSLYKRARSHLHSQHGVIGCSIAHMSLQNSVGRLTATNIVDRQLASVGEKSMAANFASSIGFLEDMIICPVQIHFALVILACYTPNVGHSRCHLISSHFTVVSLDKDAAAKFSIFPIRVACSSIGIRIVGSVPLLDAPCWAQMTTPPYSYKVSSVRKPFAILQKL